MEEDLFTHEYIEKLKTNNFEVYEEDPELQNFQCWFQKKNEVLLKFYDIIQGYPGKWQEFTQAYKYYGIQETVEEWIVREWLPGAKEVYFTGEFNNWNLKELKME